MSSTLPDPFASPSAPKRVVTPVLYVKTSWWMVPLCLALGAAGIALILMSGDPTLSAVLDPAR